MKANSLLFELRAELYLMSWSTVSTVIIIQRLWYKTVPSFCLHELGLETGQVTTCVTHLTIIWHQHSYHELWVFITSHFNFFSENQLSLYYHLILTFLFRGSTQQKYSSYSLKLRNQSGNVVERCKVQEEMVNVTDGPRD